MKTGRKRAAGSHDLQMFDSTAEISSVEKRGAIKNSNAAESF